MVITDRRPGATKSSRWVRVAWLFVIWLAGVASLGLLAGGIRLVMNAAGLISG